MSSKPTGRYHIETWGCQMNVHDSEKLAGSLEGAGFVRADDAAQADVILLNTCSIREKAAEKVFSELGRLERLKRDRPELVLGVCGCVAQQEGERIFARAPYVDFVIGPRATGSLADTVLRLRAGDTSAQHHVDIAYRRDSIDFPFDEIRREGVAAGKAFVTIIEGCNHRCTYCIVPTTRGREICRDMTEILLEVRGLAASGVIEIEFLGQTVNAYRDSGGRTLADLLLATAEVEGILRIRFTTSHPAQMTDRLIDAMARARPKLCPYLHLPVQSGSSAVLRAMRRGYDREAYLNRIDALRRRIPEMFFGSDVIVGFPGETEVDFQETLYLLDEVRYATLYSYLYSPRPGTAALEIQNEVPLGLMQERLARLQARQKTIQAEDNLRWIGRDVDLLVEGPSKRDPGRFSGRNPEGRTIHFGGPAAPGTVERVRVTGATAFSLSAERLPVPFA